MADALRQVVRAASSEDSRPILTGVLMAAEGGGLRLVATDSYRLAVRDLPGAGVLTEGQKVLVPSRALTELQRCSLRPAPGVEAERVILRLGDHDATFELGHVRLTTRLIEGEFPNYRQLIPLGLPEPAASSAGSRCSMPCGGSSCWPGTPTTPVRIALRSDGIELTVITQDWGQATEDVDAKYEGAEMTVAFNPNYLIDGVEAISGDEVAAGDPRRPQAGDDPADREVGLPVPADAGAGVVSRRGPGDHGPAIRHSA